MLAWSRVIGEFLVTRKVLSRDALEEALEREAETGVPLAKLLASEGQVGERDLVAAVADALRLRMGDPDAEPIPSIVGGMLPVALCLKLRAVVVGTEADRLIVAMENPTERSSIEELAQETGWKIEAVLATADAISIAIEVMYGSEDARATPAVSPSDDQRPVVAAEG